MQEDKQVLTISNDSDDSIALKIENDSMTKGDGGVSFPRGCYIVINKNREPKPDDFVVFHKEGQDEAGFRQLVKDSGKLYLVPLNSQFDKAELDNTVKIIGVVTQQQIFF